MKIKIQNYTFNKTTKTVVFTDYTSIKLDSVLLITNVTSNIIIYNFAVQTLGGVVSGNNLILTYDTSLMSDTDSLLIYYDDDGQTTATDEMISLLKLLRKQLESNAVVDRNFRQRVTIDAIQAGTNGTTTELAGTMPVTLPASGALGFQAGLNYGQPVAGTTAYTTNTLAQSWYTPVFEGPVDQRWRVMEDSRMAYQTGIRSKLIFS